MNKVLNAVEGKKSYMVGFAMMLHAVLEVYLGVKDINSAYTEFMTGLGIVALRHGMAKIG